jgi:hypothetical protein
MTLLGSQTHRRAIDDAHRAIGRYVVEFSHLVSCMRCMIGDRLVVGTSDAHLDDADFEREIELADLVLGEASAQAIANVLFGMCRVAADLDDGERKIASVLSEAVNRTIEQRNDIAHGDWMVGALTAGGESVIAPRLVRIRPARKKEMTKVSVYAPEDLDKVSAAVRELSERVVDFGNLCLGILVAQQGSADPAAVPRVRDVLVNKNGQVLREGPMAGVVGQVHYP